MTVVPLTPAAAPFPTIGAAAGSTAPDDFLAEMLQALTQPQPALVEPVETPEVESKPEPKKPATKEASAEPTLPDPCPTVVSPTVPDPTQTVTVVQTSPASPRFDRLNERKVETPGTSPLPGKHLGTVANPGLHLGVNHTEHPVNPKHVEPVGPETEQRSVDTAPASPRLDRLDDRSPAGAAPVPAASPTISSAAGAPVTAPVSTAAATPVPATSAAAPAPITDQVFGEVTGLVSRGTGTHRITMTLQPEQLGEVRVVLTMRAGAVHVRLAAGQEARAALVDGSPELHRLLEHAGATETRVVVRELPASAVAAAPQSQTSGNHSSSNQASSNQASANEPSTNQQGAQQTPTTDTATGDRSPDRHAGTRADHLATDGDDNTRGHRTHAPRDVTPIRSVASSHLAGVDLTM